MRSRHKIVGTVAVGMGLLAATSFELTAGQAPEQDFGMPGRLSLQHQIQHAKFLADREPTHDLPAMSATLCVGGTAGPYPCNNIDLMSFTPLASMGGGQGNDIWGWTDPVNGDEYAIMGRTSGTSFVDITDPENPVYVGNLPTHTVNSSWRDIKVYDDHAFIVSEASGHGMQVFDLNQLRTVVSPPVTFSETAHYGNMSNSHNIVINEDSGYAYAVGTNTCSGGLHVIDISTPTTPTFVGCVDDDGYTHDAQCVMYGGPDPDYAGAEICVNSNEDTVTIYDVTDKTSWAVQISRTGYAGSRYTHQGWLTEDHRYFLLDDELDEVGFGHNTRTRVFDVTDLDNPVLVGFHDGRTTAIDHNQYVLGGRTYQANYRSGLSVLEIGGVATSTMSEIGYFDIYPLNDSVSFNGAWSVFPYYSSGSIVVSGIEQGLFVLRLDPLVLGDTVPGVAGVVNSWDLSGATPNKRVGLAYGFSRGSTAAPVPGCPNLRLDITPARVADVGTADGDGEAIFAKDVPIGAEGLTVHLQAADLGDCGTSNVVETTFE